MGRMVPADPTPGAQSERALAGVILAGGRGTRMGSLTDHLPKPMLPVAGRPLVVHQLERLNACGVTRVAISTGYRGAAFERVLDAVPGLEVLLAHEPAPLGTGGGCAYAVRHLRLDRTCPVVVLNGDLLTSHDLGAQLAAHEAAVSRGARATIHVRQIPDPRDYGCVVVDAQSLVTAFHEKSDQPPSSLVNAGTYVIRADVLLDLPEDQVISMERDVFPALAAAGQLTAYEEDAYFLDVGTPQALAQAEQDLGSG